MITGEDIRKWTNVPIAQFVWDGPDVIIYADRGHEEALSAMKGQVGVRWQRSENGVSCKYLLEIDPRFSRSEIEALAIEAILDSEPESIGE